MFNTRRSLPIVATLLLVLVAYFSVSQQKGSTESVSPTPTPPSPVTDKRPFKREDFPVVDYRSSISNPSEVRRARKYDGALPHLSAELTKDVDSFLALDWSKDLSPLPVEKSDLIVLGKVAETSAILSPDKTTVFSKIDIDVEQIFKNSASVAVGRGGRLVAEREGGVVRYPSGFKQWHRIVGQRIPCPGQRYLFFLTREFPVYGRQQEDFYLITAYELKDGQVLPLDTPGESRPSWGLYYGKKETELLSALNNAIDSSQ